MIVVMPEDKVIFVPYKLLTHFKAILLKCLLKCHVLLGREPDIEWSPVFKLRI